MHQLGEQQPALVERLSEASSSSGEHGVFYAYASGDAIALFAGRAYGLVRGK